VINVLDRFTIHQPQSLAEASAMLTRFGPDAAIYAGGTELLIVMKERLAHFPHLIDIKRIPGLKEIDFDAERGELSIGAVATHRDLERSPVVRERFPALGMMAAAVANIRVRNAGTIGGNLCFAEPHSDPATLLTALDARLTLTSTSGIRQVPMASFITGLMETARRHEEVLVTIAADIIRDEVETSGDVFESEAYTRQLARTVGRRAVAAAIQRTTGKEGGRRAA
jgi:carbon-monoxide dehydrogenase medium subunit